MTVLQLVCMATAIFFEAGNQPMAGKIAVGNVIMNRVNDYRYPETPCLVVKQSKRSGCQFSYWCDGKPERANISSLAYKQSWRAATMAYNKAVDASLGATHYHADYVHPNWAEQEKVTVRIAQHIFYRL